jgi:hypothetical protein
MSRIFYDERGYCVTEEKLYKEYEELLNKKEIDLITFEQFVKNCTDKNGTLTEVKNK